MVFSAPLISARSQSAVRRLFVYLLACTVYLAGCANAPGGVNTQAAKPAAAVVDAQLSSARVRALESDDAFTLAMIPDTQNYTDYTHQKSNGFVLDAADLFIAQMQYIADNAVGKGGDIAFVAAVGDVWQHQSKSIDAGHAARGFKVPAQMPEALRSYFGGHEETKTFELPKATEGYRLIHEAGLPFGVAPGNHDYDAMWSIPDFKPDTTSMSEREKMMVDAIGMLHIGGLDNFRSVFGSDSDFFQAKPWYLAGYNGGSSSAQTFTAGGYKFLHMALEMQPSDEVLRWAESVLAQFPGLPTIVSTHDYLSTAGERVPNPVLDLAAVDPEGNNSAQQVWEKFFSQHDQILMVLCGHQHGQNYRIDDNVNGLPVYQILADYQDRAQVAIDAGLDMEKQRFPIGIGDGWFRLLTFDLNSSEPVLHMQTYSTHYKKYSGDEPNYAKWYRHIEQPEMSDAEFYQADDYQLDLSGFHERFAGARVITVSE